MFSQAGQSDMASFYFEQYRNTPGITREDQLLSWVRQGLTGQTKEIRWQSMIALVVDFGENSALIDLVLAEAKDADDAQILGKLADELKSGPFQSRLLLRQMDLAPAKEQANIIIRLLKAGEFPESRLGFAENVVKQEQRSTEVIEIIEGRLKKGQQLTDGLLQLLGSAYLNLDRKDDYARVISGKNEHAAVGIKPETQKVNRNRQGVGIF
jgi:hypothetical protein